MQNHKNDQNLEAGKIQFKKETMEDNQRLQNLLEQIKDLNIASNIKISPHH